MEYMKTYTDEDFYVPEAIRGKFDNKKLYKYKDLNAQQCRDYGCREAYRKNIVNIVARFLRCRYGVPVSTFVPISTKYGTALGIWQINTEEIARLQMQTNPGLEEMIEHLNNTIGGPNWDGTKAMWWCDSDSVKQSRCTWLSRSTVHATSTEAEFTEPTGALWTLSRHTKCCSLSCTTMSAQC